MEKANWRTGNAGFVSIPLFFGTAVIGSLITAAIMATATQPQGITSPIVSTQVVAASSDASESATLEGDVLSVELDQATLIEVVNENTLRVTHQEQEKNIRLIGITPALSPLSDSCTQNLTDELAALLPKGETIYLVTEATTGEHDPEGNLFRYVFLKDGTFLNKKLLENGFAQQFNFLLVPYLYEAEFKAAEKQAQENHLGIWSAGCTEIIPSPSPTPSPTPTPTPTSSPKPSTTTASPTPMPTFTLTSLVAKEATKSSVQNTLQEKIAQNIKKIELFASPSPFQRRLTGAPLAPVPLASGVPPVSLNSDVIFSLINAHRKNLGKPEFLKDEKICSIAASRGPALYEEIFVNRNMHAGFYALNLPYWATENVAHYNSEQTIFNWWLSSRVHRSAIEGDYTHSCGACYGNSCAQIFTSFAAK